MQEIERQLTSIGLTPTEARIYLAGLSFKSAGVRQLLKLTQLKRPTIYHGLNTLIAKGLAAKTEKNGLLEFIMSHPRYIKGLIERQKELIKERERDLEKIIGLLGKDYLNKQDESFNVSHYEGIEGIKMVIDIALYCRQPHWDIIAPVNNFFREFDKDYAAYFLRKRKAHQITARSLWEDKPNSRALTLEEIKERQPRIMPKIMQGRFKSLIILFDDKAAIISSFEKRSAILIASKEIHDMFLAIFDGLWTLAKKYATT